MSCIEHPLTIMMMIMQLVRVRLNLRDSGKYGSSAPVTGFLVVMGAIAANSGLGRSYKQEHVSDFLNDKHMLPTS